MIDRYLNELAAQLALHGVRGRRAARLCAEARDHLLELAAEHGEEEAVSRFGPSRTLAIEAARAAHPVMLLRSTLVFLAALVALRAAALRNPREHAAACTMGRASRLSDVEALRLRRRLRDRCAGCAGRRSPRAWRRRRRTTLVALGARRGLARGRARRSGRSAPSSGRRQCPERARRSLLTLARERLPGVGGGGVASIGDACRSPRPRPTSPT